MIRLRLEKVVSMSTQHLDLPVTGMTCAACVRNVERALKRTDGVAEANVNIATERASVDFDSAQVDASKLIASIENAGYGVAVGRLELPITGMTCASCVRNVERASGPSGGRRAMRRHTDPGPVMVARRHRSGSGRRSSHHFIAEVLRALATP
jgi:copper ion binding protein